MISDNLIQLFEEGEFVKVSAPDVNTFFKEIGGKLGPGGYINNEFVDEITKREKKYPTGLVTEAFPIAMPHVDAKYVLRNAIVVCIMDPKIEFCRMDAPSEKLDVKLAFVLLIKDPKVHTSTISELVNIFMNKELLREIGTSSSKKEVIEIIREQNRKEAKQL